MEHTTSQLKSLWSKLSSGMHHTSYKKTGLRPHEDWINILAFLAIGFVISAGIAFFVYGAVADGAFVTVLPQQAVSQSPTLNAGQLDAVTKYFTAKQGVTSTSTPSDPSK
jgi:hypothetical protein